MLTITIKTPYLRIVMITPDPAIVLSLTSAIASGKSLWLPMQESRTYHAPGLNSTEQQLTCAVGAYSSVDSVITTFYSATARRDRTKDKYMLYHDPGLKHWTMTLAELTNPARGYFQAGDDDPETLMVTLLSELGSVHNFDQVYLDNEYAADNTTPVNTFALNHFRFGLNFVSDNESHGSGVSLVGSSSGNVVIDCSFKNAIPSDIVAYTTVTCSVLLEVTGGLINIWRVFNS